MCALVIALPLAIWFRDKPFLGEAMLQLAGMIQTIPSLALLGLLIPLVGIGPVPAVIALTLYAIMPIYQNTYTGLKNIDPNLSEAADAFGLSKRKKLQRLELPLALPLIFSGIRIALVLVIGTATLAAFIGAGGLGTYIMLGIQQNNNTYLLIGGILSAALAFGFSFGLKYIGQTKKRILITLGLLATCLVGLAGYQTYEALREKLQGDLPHQTRPVSAIADVFANVPYEKTDICANPVFDLSSGNIRNNRSEEHTSELQSPQ